MELIGSMILVLVVYATAVDKNNKSSPMLPPLLIGLTVSVAHLLLIPALYLLSHTENASGAPLTICQFIAFFFPSINFLVYPFIETMFSENLRKNFLELIMWKLS